MVQRQIARGAVVDDQFSQVFAVLDGPADQGHTGQGKEPRTDRQNRPLSRVDIGADEKFVQAGQAGPGARRMPYVWCSGKPGSRFSGRSNFHGAIDDRLVIRMLCRALEMAPLSCSHRPDLRANRQSVSHRAPQGGVFIRVFARAMSPPFRPITDAEDEAMVRSSTHPTPAECAEVSLALAIAPPLHRAGDCGRQSCTR